MCFWWIVLPIFHELKLKKFAGMVKYFVFQFVEVFEVPGCWEACTMATDIVQLYGFASVSFFDQQKIHIELKIEYDEPH
jgi:hypothetical protein